jgi:parallel beta-helix repeat protein
MSFNKTQKCIGVIAAVAVLGSIVAKADIGNTIANAKTGTTVSVSGTYSVAEEVHVPSAVTVKGSATFNFTTGSSTTAGLYCSSGSGQKIQSITVTGANHGIYVTTASVQVTSCTAHDNWNTGIQVSDSGGKNCTISGCTSYDNVDKESGGGNADGICVKSGAGSGNQVSNCTAHNNSDDGFDYEKDSSPVVSSGLVSYNEGSYDGYQGNGNGIKMGIGGDNIAHSYTSCTAYNNTAGNSPHGFSTNGNTGKIHLTTCHSYGNKEADVLGNCVLSNCTMQTN